MPYCKCGKLLREGASAYCVKCGFETRQAEYTADRGGFVACGDLAASQRSLARLAIGPELFDRLNIEEFVKQARSGGVSTIASEIFSSHPLLAKRLLALEEFAQSPLGTHAQQANASAGG